MLCGWLSWFKALNGRLIGPKTWDRIVEIFGARNGQFVTIMDCLGCLCCDLFIKSCLMCMRPELAMDFGFTKCNRCWMIGREQ